LFIKNYQQILLNFTDFAWLEHAEANLMNAISRVWYNGSYTIAAKPIKTLELHYTMIQFLITHDRTSALVIHSVYSIQLLKEPKFSTAVKLNLAELFLFPLALVM